jgi:hypothetical protein
MTIAAPAAASATVMPLTRALNTELLGQGSFAQRSPIPLASR